MYRFYAPTCIDLRILDFALQNEESLELPRQAKEQIIDYLQATRNKRLVFEDLTYGADGVLYIVLNSDGKFYCYELSDDLLERTNYGMA